MDSADECRSACQAKENCANWILKNGKNCSMKAKTTGTLEVAGVVSGLRYCKGRIVLCFIHL